MRSCAKNAQVLLMQNSFCSLLYCDTSVGLGTKDISAFGNGSLFIRGKTVTWRTSPCYQQGWVNAAGEVLWGNGKGKKKTNQDRGCVENSILLFLNSGAVLCEVLRLFWRISWTPLLHTRRSVKKSGRKISGWNCKV